METNEVKDKPEVKGPLDQLRETVSKMVAEFKDSEVGENSEVAVFVKQVLAAKSLIVIEEENLTVPMLAKAVKENKVPNSNQVVVYKKAKEDGFVVSFSFAMDKKLLPESENKYVAFLSKTLDEALIKLFGDKDLIVLR